MQNECINNIVPDRRTTRVNRVIPSLIPASYLTKFFHLTPSTVIGGSYPPPPIITSPHRMYLRGRPYMSLIWKGNQIAEIQSKLNLALHGNNR